VVDVVGGGARDETAEGVRDAGAAGRQPRRRERRDRRAEVRVLLQEELPVGRPRRESGAAFARNQLLPFSGNEPRPSPVSFLRTAYFQ